jgi:hypothetical protein
VRAVSFRGRLFNLGRQSLIYDADKSSGEFEGAGRTHAYAEESSCFFDDYLVVAKDQDAEIIPVALV